MSGADAAGPADGYELREPRPADVDACTQLHARIWRETYRGIMPDEVVDRLSPEGFRPTWERVAQAYQQGTVPQDGRAFRVAFVDGEPVGFVMTGPALDDDPPSPRQVYALNVAPERQGTGLAQRLLAEAFGDGPGYLWVARGNDRAVRFYERHGFVLDGTAAEDRHDGLTELRMVRATVGG